MFYSLKSTFKVIVDPKSVEQLKDDNVFVNKFYKNLQVKYYVQVLLFSLNPLKHYNLQFDAKWNDIRASNKIFFTFFTNEAHSSSLENPKQ